MDGSYDYMKGCCGFVAVVRMGAKIKAKMGMRNKWK